MSLSARRWLELWQRLGAPRSADGTLADEFVALKKCYDEKHRHYHGTQHIGECLAHFDSARTLCEHADEVELALWFHDAIYELRAKDNEAQSAAWAERVMRVAGISGAVKQRVHALIMKTCHDSWCSRINSSRLEELPTSMSTPCRTKSPRSSITCRQSADSK